VINLDDHRFPMYGQAALDYLDFVVAQRTGKHYHSHALDDDFVIRSKAEFDRMVDLQTAIDSGKIPVMIADCTR
jgi:hypothetical protein